ncbi:MAG: hypothetical protein AMS24_03520 [Chlamydiae bacterium SM23_39]|nr:MAG: hypothetical protein AMS24_03520 [Chlamydiae bacterium SM23_39]
MFNNNIKKKKFLFFSIIYIFLISFEYSFIRPASTSIFIHNFKSESLPYAWIAMIPLNFFVIYGYNYFLPKIGSFRLFFLLSLMTIFVNTTSVFYNGRFVFFQFIWKEIYILLMLKQIWSLIHSSIDFKNAKYIYGILFATGGIGGLLGGVVPGFFASNLGSSRLFFVTLPIYSLLILIYFKAYYYSNIFEKKENFDKNIKGYFFTLKNSKYLIFLLLIVLFMQMSVTLIDYQFNFFLEKNILNVDLRTEYIGKLTCIIHSITIFLQLIGSFLIIRFLGLRKIHLIIPLSLLGNLILLLFKPTFFIISYLFVYIKSMDFSIFNISKEMLYLPVKIDEKFRAKAIIDVFSYRTAKGLSSICLLFVGFFNMNFLIFYFLLMISIIWILSLRFLFKEHNLLGYSIL